MSGKLVAIVGPSGVGKTTIISALVDVKRRFERILFYTTRPRRFYELHGRDYWFVAMEELEAISASDETLQESMVIFDGNRFAVSYSGISRLISLGQTGLIELYIDRLPEFKDRYGNDFMSLFLMPPSMDVLSQRLRDCRHHDDSFIAKRMAQAQREIDLAFDGIGRFIDDSITLSLDVEESVGLVERSIARLVSARVAGS